MLEQPRPRARRARLYGRHALAQPRRVRERPRPGRGVSAAQMESRAGLSPEEGTLGLWRPPASPCVFEYEYHDDSGQWFRAYGNENWEFDDLGYMKFRYASIKRPTHQRKRTPVPLGTEKLMASVSCWPAKRLPDNRIKPPNRRRATWPAPKPFAWPFPACLGDKPYLRRMRSPSPRRGEGRGEVPLPCFPAALINRRARHGRKPTRGVP